MEQEQAREVELAVGNGIEQSGELPDEPRGARVSECGVFGESQLIDAIRAERRASAGAMDSAGFDLREMGEQSGELEVGARDETASPGEELGVGEMLDGVR